MATFPQNPISGSPLIGSPIVVTVLPKTHNPEWMFHRLLLRVYAGLIIPDSSDINYPSDINYTELEFSTPVASDNAVTFDISSSLQAVMARYEHAATPPSKNPYIKFRIKAWDEYMYQGITYTSDEAFLPGKVEQTYLFYYAFKGEFTDFERMLSSDSRGLTHWTRKPTTIPEVVFCEERFVYPIDFETGLESDYVDEETGDFVDNHPTEGPESREYLVSAEEGAQTLAGRQIYAITKPDNGYVVRFINRLGCMESLHLKCLPKKTVNPEPEQYDISRNETFNKFSRGLVVTPDSQESWKMTSGPLDEAWVSWFVHEFLVTQYAWIKMPSPAGGYIWLPVHIVPDESVTIIDKEKSTPCEVQFTLQLDINGSPMSALVI